MLPVSDLVELAAKNDVTALNNLGIRYERGDGVPKDLRKAYFMYLRAARRGCLVAQDNLHNTTRLGMPQSAVPIFREGNVWDGEKWLALKAWDGFMVNTMTGRKMSVGTTNDISGPPAPHCP